jgi:HD-GYP domain-containing protein (c-di-GMP phosphodiesterase class II)
MNKKDKLLELNNVEEVEDLEEIDESESITARYLKEPDFSNLSILESSSVELWIKSYYSSPMPLLILDNNLIILWANKQFESLFGNKKKYFGYPIIQFYKDNFNKEMTDSLFKNIKNKKKAYSWKGQVAKKGKEQLTINSNLLILPVFNSPALENEPLAYAVILDDVSGEYKKMLRNTFTSLLEASKLKDNDTGFHIQRVNEYSKLLTKEIMNIPEYGEIDREFLTEIEFLAALHDVGKIGTPDNILNKQGPLNNWEWDIMQEHTINGAFILSTYPSPMARQIALFHHEKWNGSGYPYGISQEMIPLCARIVAIADVYDALRMQRSYKDAFAHEKAMKIMKKEKGKHFEPYLIETFVKINDKFSAIYDRLKDDKIKS